MDLDVPGPQPGEAKVKLWQSEYILLDSLSVVRKMSGEEASISGRKGPGSRSKMVGNGIRRTWSLT